MSASGNRFRNTFTKQYTFLAVVHVVSNNLVKVYDNVAVAQENGADGVFLINHGVSPRFLLDEVCPYINGKFPDYWTGVNCLGMRNEDVFAYLSDLPNIKGVWSDNAGIDDDSTEQSYPRMVQEVQGTRAEHAIYFGGTAFKYQHQPKNLDRACRYAMAFMDVVCTSGPGTGKAADVNKIKTMKRSIEDHPLAIASGITPENVMQYAGIADCFLAATGVSLSFDKLNPILVKKLTSTLAVMEKDNPAQAELRRAGIDPDADSSFYVPKD